MIPKISCGTSHSYPLVRYLYGPGKSNEHTDPHLVASWNDFAPDPGRNPRHTIAQLAGQLDLPAKAKPPRPRKDGSKPEITWHCSLRTAPGDRYLSDQEWATAARRVLNAVGIAPTGDTKACRWVAVRHADDHIHIAATLVRQDGRRPKRDWDKKKAQAECRLIEKEWGLRGLNPGDGTAPKRPTSKEHFKAERLGRPTTARQHLRTTVWTAASAAETEEQFFALLAKFDLKVEIRRLPSGHAQGYKVALPTDVNTDGQPVWYSGSTLDKALSLPRIRERLTPATEQQPTSHRPTAHERAITATRRIPDILNGPDDAAATAQLAALQELLTATTNTAPGPVRGDLHHAATLFARAATTPNRPNHREAQPLRSAARAILRTAPDGDLGAALLATVLVAVIATAHWLSQRGHAQQAAAARQAIPHLEAAYRHTARQTIAELAARQPAPDTTRRYEHDVRAAVGDQADEILSHSTWPAIVTTLAAAERVGHTPARLLQEAAATGDLGTGIPPGEDLTWRLTHLGRQPAPSTRTTAALARTTQQLPTRQTSAPAARQAVPVREERTRRR